MTRARLVAPAVRRLVPLVVVSTAIATLTSGYALGVFVPAFNSERTPVSGFDHPPSPLQPTPGLARRLVFVVVDGLKFDVARELPELAELRRAGVLRPLIAEPLTYTGPEITAMISGLPPRDSGVRLNGSHQGVPGIDTVTAELAAAHVPIEVDDEAFQPFAGLLRVPEGTKVVSGRVQFVAEIVERRLGLFPPLAPIDLKGPTREVAFVHIEDVDEAGHLHGGASPEYLDAAHRAGTLVSRIAETLDLEQDALVAVSDHGHRDRGGHGGVEPEVVGAFFLGAGAIFRRGVEIGQRPMRDVAPTLAVVAGVRAPTSSVGRPMIDAFSVDEPVGSVLLAGPYDQTAHYLCKLAPQPRCKDVDALVPRLAGHDPEALGEAETLLAELAATREDRLAARAGAGREVRAGVVAVLGLGLAALLGRVIRRAGRGALGPSALAAPFAHAAAYLAYLYARGYRPSFSAMTAGFAFARGAVPAAMLGALAVAALAGFTRPGRLAPWLLLLAITAPYAVLVAAVGVDATTVAPPVAGVLVLELGPAVVGAALGAVAMAVVDLVREARAPDLSTSAQNR